MVDNRVMLTRVKFPMAIFPIARVYSALVNFLYTFVAYLLMLLAFRIRPGITMLAAPAVILCVTLFSLGWDICLRQLTFFLRISGICIPFC